MNVMKNLSDIHFSRSCTTRIVCGEVVKSLPELLPEGRVVAFVDAEVDAEYNISELIPESVIIPGGEENKNLELATMMWQELVESRADRQTFLLGVGGGVVCDLVGFVAATYMRGVRFGLVPTTLLAQVDAAIGGKCGVNMGGYKNMVGALAPADFVLCDATLLSSLPDREFRAGLAEMIKAAVIGDAELFELFENHTFEQLREDAGLLGEMVARSIAVKCDIVARDPYENGERRLLNLGHTWAHAIESISTDYTHGEAVAVGMVYATRKAQSCGMISPEEAERIVAVVERYGLPTTVVLADDALAEAMTHDKKSTDGLLHLVLPTRVGKCVVV